MNNEREIAKRDIKYYNKTRNFTKAIVEIDKYIKMYPGDYYMQVYKAMVLSKMSRFEESISIANSILNDYVDNDTKAFASEILAIYNTSIKDYEKAIYHWELSLSLSSLKIYSKARISLSKLYYRVGKVDDAFNILDLDGYNTVGLNVGRAYIYYEQSEYKEALKCLDRPVTEKFESDDEYENISKYYMKAMIYQKLNRIKEALALYKKVMSSSDNTKVYYWDSLHQIAVINYMLGDDYKAIQVCKELINKSGKTSYADDAYLLYANIYIKKYDLESAYNIFSKCEDNVEKNIGYARIAIAKYDFEEALRILNSIKTTDENRVYNINYMYAQIMFRYNNYDEFLKYYDLVINSKNKDRNMDSIVETKRMMLYFDAQKKLSSKEYTGGYCDKQIVHYNSEDAINHIKERHIHDEYNDNFKSKDDIELLFYHILRHLEESKKICDGLTDKYIIDLNAIGYKLDGISYVTAVCIANTNHIITMYPSNWCVGVLNEQEDKSKRIRLSAIEKFNKKYGM